MSVFSFIILASLWGIIGSFYGQMFLEEKKFPEWFVRLPPEIALPLFIFALFAFVILSMLFGALFAIPAYIRWNLKGRP